ncbi:MAG TPA: histidine triad nucleotide-binding protein [Anaerolineaceae bacterium]|nr:histidine triad nucleotide-binding protein [Anaerolineaceae bacterium]HPN51389.1 histidine triad nucleotide-binding protein [Anaerolineaceae bacterium]
MTCLFCQIASGNTPTSLIYQDEWVVGFRDIAPKAPVHFLLVPRRHLASLNDATPEDQALLGHLLLAAQAVARQQKIDQSGFRLVVNTGPDGGQSVYHLHMHMLGGGHLPFRMCAE